MQNQVFSPRSMGRMAMCVALISVGGYIAEAGRQPWIVVGLQKTAAAVSPNLTAGEVGLTIAGFTAVYLVLIAVAIGIGFRHIYNTKIAED